MGHRRDNSRIRPGETRVNSHPRRCARRATRRRDRPSRKSLPLRCAQAPSRPEGLAERGGGAERSALDGAEHSVMLSHVMAGRLAPREPIPKPADVAFASHVTTSERCGQERGAEVVDEEFVNGDHNARHRLALPPW